MSNFPIKSIFFLLASAFLLTQSCTQKPSFPEFDGTFLNINDTMGYVGMNICGACHVDRLNTYIHTGMGHSFGPATKEKSAATYGDHALVYNEGLDFYYKPFFRGDSLYLLEFRLENGDTIHKREEHISYIIGSGQHTNSHIVDINGYIYQAPVTFYTQESKWDMAPGFQGPGNERFDRFLTAECITCHNNLPEQEAGSLNKFSKMPEGIECERCHGPGRLHTEFIQAGNLIDTSKYTDYTIITPTKLDRELQMDLCQRCHLQGVAVLEEGKTFYDFLPGMALSEVANVFLPRYSDSHKSFIMASQADRLRLSNCYKQSGMTCTSCHDPHQSVDVSNREKFRSDCLSCHDVNSGLVCLEAEAERKAQSDDCITCHMPPSGSIDIPHVRITDHYIRKYPQNQLAEKTGGEPQFLGLKILTKPKASPIEMARGYIAMFEKYVESPLMLDSAGYYLDRSELLAVEKFQTQIHYHFAKKDYTAILKASTVKPLQEISDGWTAYRIGEAWYNQGDFTTAIQYFEQATKLMPLTLSFYEKLSAAYINLNKIDQAQSILEFVLKENPKQKVALSNLGFVCALKGEFEKGEQLYDQAIALDPDYEQALINKVAIRKLKGDNKSAKLLLKRVLKINPDNAQAAVVLSQLE